MPIEIRGLDQIKRNFTNFKFAGPRVQKRFLRVIGQATVELARFNTPSDSGDLSNQWKIVGISENEVQVGVDDIELIDILTRGQQPHLIEPKDKTVLRFEKDGQEIFAARVFHTGSPPNPFIDEISRLVGNLVIETLEVALREQHPFFSSLRGVGGKGRRFQQVGRTSAGFKGGVSFAGRSNLVRVGTGRRQLKRRLALRRRRGGSILTKKKEVKLG